MHNGKLRKGEIWTQKTQSIRQNYLSQGKALSSQFRMKHSNAAWSKGHYYWLGCICLGSKSGGLRLSANGW